MSRHNGVDTQRIDDVFFGAANQAGENDLDLVEIDEAFASQAIACQRALGFERV